VFKQLDTYIFRKFISTFVFALLLFTMVAVVIDLVEKLDDLIEKQVPISELILDYYVNFIPHIDALLTPLFVFIAVIFFTSRLAYRTEIVAMLASGISYYRVLLPFFVAALLIAAMLWWGNNYAVPNANKQRLAFEVKYINAYARYRKNVHLQVQKNHYIFMENYASNDSTGYKFSYEIFNQGQLVYKLRSDRVQWNGNTGKWTVKNYVVREFNRDGETFEQGKSFDTIYNFTPIDLEKRKNSKEEMNTTELLEYIDLMKARGEEGVEFYYIELYRRTADSAMVLILTLIGATIASRKVRGGMGFHLAMGFALAGLYIVFTQFSKTFSTNGNLPPILGIWIPNIVFAALGVWLFKKAQK
jgi:lipopolysaccharide export system permease protein